MRNQYDTFPEISIEEFDAITEDHEFSNTYKARKRGLIRKYQRKAEPGKKLFGLTPAAAAAMIFGLCTVTAFAGVSIYQFVVQQKSAYSMEAGLQLQTIADLKEVDEVSLSFGFIPEDMELSGKGTYTYISEENDRGYYVDTIVVDTEGSWTENYVFNAKTLSVGERESLLVETGETADDADEWKQYDLLISFPEYQRIVKVWGWGHVNEEELIKVGENIEMQPTGNKVAVSDQATWSQYLTYKTADLSAPAAEERDLTSTEKEMNNLHQIGETFVQTDSQSADGISVKVSAKVTGMELADNVSLLQPQYIEDSWKEILDANGQIGSAALQFKTYGDGVDTLGRIVHTESVPMKLVYVTMELKNEGISDLPEYGFGGSLMRILHEGNRWRIPKLGDNVQVGETYDSVEYTTPCLGFNEMFYWDIDGTHPTEKNYITNFAAGDTKEVHMAWLIPEDETDHLYLNLGDNWQEFNRSDLELGYVELSVNR